MNSLARFLVYALFIGVMVFAGLQLGEPRTASAEASCCNYGQDCTSKAAPRCCLPALEADCSPGQPNYCRLRCN